MCSTMILIEHGDIVSQCKKIKSIGVPFETFETGEPQSCCSHPETVYLIFII